MRWEGTSPQTIADVISANYPNLPNYSVRLVYATVFGSATCGLLVFKYNNDHGKVTALNYTSDGIRVYRLLSGTWSYRDI